MCLGVRYRYDYVTMAIFTKYSIMLPSYVTRTGGVVYDQSQLQHKIFWNFYQNLISCLLSVSVQPVV